MTARVIRVVDFETTGTAPPAVVIELGRCDVVVKDQSVEVFGPHAWLHGADRIPPETRAIHHIAPSDIAGKVPFYAQPFVQQAKDDGVIALAAHNADFEAQWLGPVLNGMAMICTYKVALRLWPDAPGHSNQCLRYWLQDQGLAAMDDETASPAHRAGPDAYATAHLLKAELGLATVDQMIAWSREPKALPRIPIGKQRGARWCDVDGGFLSWMLRQPDMDNDLAWNARRELERRGTDRSASEVPFP